MISSLLNILKHGCAHERQGWPMRAVGSHSISGDEGRQRCLDCGMYRYRTLDTSGPWIRDIGLR